MNLRRLIYLSAKPSTEIRQYFEERDWDVKVVRSSKDAKKAADDAEAAGGLLDLAAGLPSHEIEALETGLSMPNVGWVAIVSPGQLGDATLRHLVRDYCSDYVTVPFIPKGWAELLDMHTEWLSYLDRHGKISYIRLPKAR
ncbi:hypothetical protein PPGU19_026910 [Paraburkholderia sp. PGU19]|nr:hypothetical protein PPGU19_026910 [Paraburkholderia sp. PGU19]